VEAQATPSADAPWPTSVKVLWGNEPVEVQSSKRARVNLNGAWKFSPASSVGANTPPQQGWGYIKVPGNWRRTQHPDLIAQGTGPQWTGFDGRKLAGAWYERRFKVPSEWSGRHISLDFQRISTDATVWVNDSPLEKSIGPKANSTSPIW
jgi:beta-galactosidase/beta-glucuronidase